MARFGWVEDLSDTGLEKRFDWCEDVFAGPVLSQGFHWGNKAICLVLPSCRFYFVSLGPLGGLVVCACSVLVRRVAS